MKQSGCRESSGIRVLSPRIEPPLYEEEGSIDNTAMVEGENVTPPEGSLAKLRVGFPSASAPKTCKPNFSMKELFPAPGGPAKPTRKAPPEAEGGDESEEEPAREASLMAWSRIEACSFLLASVDSISVTALERARRLSCLEAPESISVLRIPVVRAVSPSRVAT
jgi:hypothetical protein